MALHNDEEAYGPYQDYHFDLIHQLIELLEGGMVMAEMK